MPARPLALSNTALVAALGSMLLAAPAHADRSGDGPIDAPGTVKSAHVAFQLTGTPWRQVVRADNALPIRGRYRLDTALADGTGCALDVLVRGRRTARPPSVGGNSVKLLPATSAYALRYTDSGRRGPVRWWAGTTFYAQSGGVQRLPGHLRTKQRRFLVYWVRVRDIPAAGGDACRALALRTSLRIAKTMHLTAGPPASKPPFATAQPLPPLTP